ncbi:MAG TPA: PhzF family phenazine biosynthesis protein [Steroidobacteraceae bacterium]|nr:PhzF family phenazine biosynthesis protein [Steroidobacteraceae bacterium]
MAHQLHVVDVFAERPYAGNQLAVVISEQPLPDATMQLIAAETNYSETTFVAPAPEADGGYRVRMFTPAREIAFAGHPIIGTAWVLRQQLGLASPTQLHLNLPVGQVRVTFERDCAGADVAWFVAPPITLGTTCDPAPMAAALGILRNDLDPDLPVQRAAAGTAAMIVPVRTIAALHRSKLDLDAYAQIAAKGFPPLVYLFCLSSLHHRNDIAARFFFDAQGVREDPATGNAAAFLGAYLLEHGLFKGGFSLRIEQGHRIRRPSILMLRGRVQDGEREIAVGGWVVPTIRGELLHHDLYD